MSEFNFDSKIAETSWLIDSFIPMSHLAVILAQAGVGKSLLVEGLAVHTVYGVPFCEFKSIEGDVLLIDQDTPSDVLEKRLMQLSCGFHHEKKHKLFLESMRGYSLDNGTLISTIRNYPTAKLIIIDCLHSICGRLNPNYTSDMNRWAKVKERCLNGQNTMLLNHHISQKLTLSVDDLMQGETNHLAMGSSAIIQQADTYYIVGATAEAGRTNRLYIRTVSKRVSISMKPLILRLITTDNGGEMIAYEGYYEPELEDVEKDVITLFREQELDRTVKEVYEGMGHKHGEITVRKALASLERRGVLLLSRHKSNLFKYRLPRLE